MKKIIFFIVMLSVVEAFSQSPQSFKYQTVVRNNEGKALANTLIGLRISILFGSPLGNAVYVETFHHATNEFGIASINIGKGTATQGVFTAINWAAGEYFIKTEVDITGATNYDYIGTSQLLSVPYALYAEKSGKSLNDQDTSAINELQNITKSGNTITLSQGGGNVTDSDNQTINLNGFNLSISDGNTIQLPPDVDHDTINEIQLITKSGNIISLSKNGGNVTDDDNQILSVTNNQLTITNGNTVNIDQDTLNEIQIISKTGSTLTLSKNGGSITDNDNQTISLTDPTHLAISNGNTIELSAGIADLDADSTNELQSILVNHNLLSIDRGNTVIIDADTTNELQTLNFSNDTLYLSKGNYAVMNLSQIMPSGTCINSNNVNPPTGFSFSGNVIQNYNGNSWETLDSLPFIVSDQANVAFENKIYTFGNYDSSGNIIGKIQIFDPSNNTWSVLNHPYGGYGAINAIAFENKIFVLFGGNFWEYNPINNIWQSLIPIPNITVYGISGYNGKLYFMGVDNSPNVFKNIEYTISTNTWIEKTPYSQYRYWFEVTSLGNEIYILGGVISGATNLVDVYNCITDSWSTKANMNTARSNFRAVTLNNKIYAIGGPDRNIEEYDPSLNLWSIKATIPTTRDYYGCCALQDIIYVIGGTLSNKNEAYKPYNVLYIHCKN